MSYSRPGIGGLSDNEPLIVPDVFGELTGWRLFKYRNLKGGDILLKSTAMSFVWEPHVTKPAQHIGWGLHHEAPEGGCYCGYYSLSDPFKLRQRTHEITFGQGFIAGRVSLWGKVVQHNEGWRSQFMKLTGVVQELTFPEYLAKKVSQMFDVEIVSLDMPQRGHGFGHIYDQTYPMGQKVWNKIHKYQGRVVGYRGKWIQVVKIGGAKIKHCEEYELEAL